MITETATVERLSNTSLTQFKRSPLHYLYYKANKMEPTDAMIFGAAFHCFILENEKFSNHYFTINPDERPEKDKTMTSKLNQAWKDEIITANKGKQLISAIDLDTISRMNDSLQRCTPAIELMSELSDVETPLEWMDTETGLPMYGRMDGKGSDFSIDLKTCLNASNEQFTRDAFNSDYPRQAALYVDGRQETEGKATDFYFICIEKNPPYAVSVQKCSLQFLSHGRLQYVTLLNDFVRWNEAGRPVAGYEWKNKQGYFDLNLPSWIK